MKIGSGVVDLNSPSSGHGSVDLFSPSGCGAELRTLDLKSGPSASPTPCPSSVSSALARSFFASAATLVV